MLFGMIDVVFRFFTQDESQSQVRDGETCLSEVYLSASFLFLSCLVLFCFVLRATTYEGSELQTTTITTFHNPIQTESILLSDAFRDPFLSYICTLSQKRMPPRKRSRTFAK